MRGMMEKETMSFAEYLEETGITQAFFAKKLNVTKATVNKWAKGTRVPTLLFHIAEIYDLTNGKVTYQDWLEQAKKARGE
jgi:transcriptional regulator with XRE-family HTH domain